MPRFLRYGLCFASLAAMAVLTCSVHQQRTQRQRSWRQLNDWDIPQLAAHLQSRGVPVQLHPVGKNGPVDYSAYLTTTAKQWPDLNALSKGPGRIDEWRGTLYCERIGDSDAAHLFEQWGDHCLQIGPFLFYGDSELLDRVRTALNPSSPGAAPSSRG